MPAISMTGITKTFGSLLANDNVSLAVEEGEIRAIVGENGAGKTTLMRIAYGLVRPDQGQVMVNDTVLTNYSPRLARRLGIGMVQQHFALVDSMTVAENMVIGDSGALLDLRKVSAKLQRIADENGLGIDPQSRVRDLPVASRQQVEIAKMLFHDANILILDEPTSVLSPAESRQLLETVRHFRASGRTVIFVSHKLPEVLSLADRITVMRRGRVVDTVDAATSERELIRLMVGELPPKVERTRGDHSQDVVLEVRGLSVAQQPGDSGLRDISLSLRRGEILGVAGVAGNGQRALSRAIAGLAQMESGTILLRNQNVTQASVAARYGLGLAYMSEDRLGEGASLSASAEDNAIIGHHRSAEFGRRGLLNRTASRQFALDLIARYDVRVEGPAAPVRTMSGGNIQRLIAGRELARSPRVLVVEEPTWGLDVRSTATIRGELVDLAKSGVGILLFSTDLDELLQLADRIVVLYRGRIAGEMPAWSAREEVLGGLMTGAAV